MCINTSDIEDISDTEFGELLGELDVVDSCIQERLDTLVEMLGVISDPADDTWYVGDDVGGVKNCVPFVDAPAYWCGNCLN